MATTFNPTSRQSSKPRLGASWVVENGSDSSDDESSDRVESQETMLPAPQPRDTPRRRSNRASSKASAEPELIMPSIHEDSLGGSWYSEDKSQLKRSPKKTFRQPTASRKASMPYQEDVRLPNRQRNRSATPPIDYLKPTITFSLEVFGKAMRIMKPLLSWCIAFWFTVGLLVILRNLFTSSIYSALSPVCRIPGSSLLNLPMCPTTLSQHQNRADEAPPVEFDHLVKVQTNFEAILEESAGGVSLPLDMKRSETSLRDLRTMLRYSNLPSKTELVFELDGFIDTAAIASNDLQRFNSHVGRAVDNILATARWTKRVLDGLALDHESRGSILGFFNDRLLAPFQPIRFTEETVLQQYTEHTRIVESEINRLIDEAQAVLSVLHNLDDRLDVIHGIAVRDDLHAQGSKEETMSQLWTMLGGNRKALGKFESQLKLLRHINVYRQTAITHVAGTMLKLQAMGAELAELRERVGTVELMGQSAGVPLSVHIESIELGVERLEQRRNWARGVEHEQRQKSLVIDSSREGTKEIGR
ncbi:MAG: hypothetical protein L6R36_006227 [Xanthoria steineri]|nr:MAG: hypothetical protein L6R36_006227 [Xanthoria steineri]